MDREEFKARLKRGEVFHDARIPSGHWCVVRVDGRGFSRLTESNFEKPFDHEFHALMMEVASVLLAELRAVAVYTQSDEASVLLPPEWAMFDRLHEKAISISSGLASSAFSATWGKPAHFDARVWVAGAPREVADYMRWRQADCHRCALSGACYWALRRSGVPPGRAAAALEGGDGNGQRALLREHAIDFDSLPAWQRHGTMLVWETLAKEGFDPVRGRETTAQRRRARTEGLVPVGPALDDYFQKLIEHHECARAPITHDGEDGNA